MRKSRMEFLLAFLLLGGLLAESALAHGYPFPPAVFNTAECPEVPYDGVTSMDEEFGAGAQEITQCLRKRHRAKVVVAVDYTHPYNPFGQVQTDKATFLSNIEKMVANYRLHGMTVGEDVDVKVVFSGSGAALATTQHPIFARSNGGDPANPFRKFVEFGLENNFKFYVCQTASRSLGINMSNKIPGINFVPGGHIAVADFQMKGYALIRP